MGENNSHPQSIGFVPIYKAIANVSATANLA
jgi:hypothetical protein